MSHTTSISRSSSILGATGLIALSMAGPASAREVPGNGDPTEQYCSSSCYEGGTTLVDTSSGSAPRVDGGTVEYVQLGAGLLAGLALAGAGAAAFSRRTHTHATA